MKKGLNLLALALLLLPLSASADDGDLLAAVQKARPDGVWNGKSVIRGDFDCDGREAVAILGSTETAVLLAVFSAGQVAHPDILSFSESRLDPATTQIQIEPLNVSKTGFGEMFGEPLTGYVASRECKGILLQDDEKDPVHVFWNRSSNKLDFWSL